MKKKLISLMLALSLLVSGSYALVSGASDPADDWVDVRIGDFENKDALLGTNGYGSTEWAVQINKADGYQPEMKISRNTDKPISGTASMMFTGTTILDWHACVRKQFTGETTFKQGVEAITFQVYTETSGSLAFSLYDTNSGANYQTNYSVTGMDKVQTITVPLTEFKAGDTDVITGMGNNLYRPQGDFTLKMEFGTDAPAEILFDNFMQTKLTGYQFLPYLNEGYELDGWMDVRIGDFENKDALLGSNGYGSTEWAVQINTADGYQPEMKVSRSTDKAISGKASMLFTGTTILDWHACVRKQFTGETKFEEGVEAITFQIYTETSGSMAFSLYDANSGANYQTNHSVTGMDKVQTITVPLAEFKAGDTDVITGMGDNLYHPLGDFALKIEYSTGAPTEILFDNFMQTEAKGYQRPPVLNEGLIPAKDYCEITLQKEGEGTVSGGGQAEQGSKATITAAAASGYTFDGWYLDGKKVSDAAEYTITVDSSKTYVAKFVKTPDEPSEPEEPGKPGEPEEPGELPSGMYPAFEISNDAFSAPEAGSIAVDSSVRLQGADAVKWSYDFSGGKANATTIQNVALAGDGFSLLAQTANDITLKVRLNGKAIDGKAIKLNYEYAIKGSTKPQLVTFDYADVVFTYDGNETNGVFGEINKKNISMTLELANATENTGDFYFNAVNYINYNEIIASVNGENPGTDPEKPGTPDDSKGPATGVDVPVIAFAVLIAMAAVMAGVIITAKKKSRS